MSQENMKIDQLQVCIYPDRQELGRQAGADVAQRLKEIIGRRGEATVVFAAAPSQNELLAYLRTSDVDWSKVRAMHMDEYIGLPDDHPARFGNFLRRSIFEQVSFREVYYLADGDEAADAACVRYARLLTEYPPDLILLGVGENGHLAFNDPPVADFADPYKVKIVELDEVCRRQQVNDGCFASLDDVPRQAITLTMSAIIAIPQAVAVVPGAQKAEAVAAMVSGPISTQCPASVLRRHDSAVVYLDQESAARL